MLSDGSRKKPAKVLLASHIASNHVANQMSIEKSLRSSKREELSLELWLACGPGRRFREHRLWPVAHSVSEALHPVHSELCGRHPMLPHYHKSKAVRITSRSPRANCSSLQVRWEGRRIYVRIHLVCSSPSRRTLPCAENCQLNPCHSSLRGYNRT
jgi:hypothetical protein